MNVKKELKSLKDTAQSFASKIEKIDEEINKHLERYNAKSDSWKESEKGTQSKSLIDKLENLRYDMQDHLDEINHIVEQLERLGNEDNS